MNIKKAYIILGTSVLICAGCSQPANDNFIVPVLSASLFEIPEPDAEIGLNEGQAIDREENTNESIEYKDGLTIESSSGSHDEDISEEEAEEISEIDNTEELTKSQEEAYSDPWDNYGKGYDFQGQHYETFGEYLRATHEYFKTHEIEGELTEEEWESLE